VTPRAVWIVQVGGDQRLGWVSWRGLTRRSSGRDLLRVFSRLAALLGRLGAFLAGQVSLGRSAASIGREQGYVVGVVLIGLGITLLIMGGVALIAGAPVIGGLICIGCVPVPMLIGGIALVRRAENRTKGGGVQTAECPAAPGSAPVGIWERIRDFDLNRLNWVGWLLLLGTFGFVGVEIAILVWLIDLGEWDHRRAMKVAATPMVLLAVGFFAGTRWLLGRLGVSIYRRQSDRAEPDAAADGGG